MRFDSVWVPLILSQALLTKIPVLGAKIITSSDQHAALVKVEQLHISFKAF